MPRRIALQHPRQNLLPRLDQALRPPRLLRLERGHLDRHPRLAIPTCAGVQKSPPEIAQNPPCATSNPLAGAPALYPCRLLRCRYTIGCAAIPANPRAYRSTISWATPVVSSVESSST